MQQTEYRQHELGEAERSLPADLESMLGVLMVETATRQEQLAQAEKSLPTDRKLEEAYRAYEEAAHLRKVASRAKVVQRRLMQRFDLFKADLEAMGIEVIIEPATYPVRVEPNRHNTSLKEGTVDDHRSSA